MDDLNAKLLQERDRLVALLAGLGQAIGALTAERLTEVLPIVTAPCAELELVACRARILGGDALGGAAWTGPLSGASILP